MGGTTKRRGTKFLKFSEEKQKGGVKLFFDLNLVGGKTLEETMFIENVHLYRSVHMRIFKENQHVANKFCITGRDNLVSICMHLY